MFRRIAIFFLLLSTSVTYGQDTGLEQALESYRSADNKWYWKNRTPGKDYWQQDVAYHIKAKLQDQEEYITGHERILYVNNSPDTIKVLYFRLSQNAFQPDSYKDRMEKGGKVFNTFGKYEKQKLGTVVQDLKIQGKEAHFLMDNTIMIVHLSEPLPPASRLEIEMGFKTYFDQGSMGRRMKRFEHDNFKHFDGVHWYPRLSVYDRKFKWTTDQHLGKEFYGDYGVYHVELELPNHYICEATGMLQNFDEVYANGLREKIDIKNFRTPSKTISEPVKPDGTYKKWIWHAQNVHDFAFTTDPTYRIGEAEWNGIKCIALAQEQNAHAWQPTAAFVADVIRVYSTDIGMYAYPKMVAADARDGMEYPMLTLDGGNWPGHQYVIAHEIGHNWFYGMIGNNETYRAALDEGFTQFLTAWSIKRISKKEAFPNSIDQAYVYTGYINHAINENTARLNVHSDHFHSAVRHGGGYSQVYYKTATMLYNLQYVLGEETFLKAIQYYFETWKICHPYEDDFRKAIIDYTKTDLNWFFDAWMTTTETIDYKVKKRITKVQNSPNEYLVTLVRKGEMHMPVDLTVVDKKGNRRQYIIPNTYFHKPAGMATVRSPWKSWDMMNRSYQIVVKADGGIRNILIDTSGRLADINRLNNSLRRPYTLIPEKATLPPADFRKYQMTWRPDLWWNEVDGVKMGLVLNGNYYNFRHIVYAALWYNSSQVSSSIRSDLKANPLNFATSYKTRIGRMLDLNARLKYLEGISLFEAGIEKTIREDKWTVQYKAFGNTGLFFRPVNATDYRNDYFLYSDGFAANKINATLNVSWQHPFRYRHGNSTLYVNLRNTSLFSNYDYAGLSVRLNSNTPLGKKLLLKSRVFGQYLSGTVAPESRLFLSGANSEDLIENKYTRSRGWVPSDWVGYGKTGAYPFQMGGGLNIRGNAGYLASNTNETDTFNIVSGTMGAALNLELEFGKLFGVKSTKIGNYLRLNPYAFADAGILGQTDQNSGLRADAGLGTTLAISFGKYNRLQPLVLRFDVPFFLNRVEPGADYLGFRYVVGINRAF